MIPMRMPRFMLLPLTGVLLLGLGACAGPTRAGESFDDGVRVPDQDEWPGGEGAGVVGAHERAQLVAVAGVVEPVGGGHDVEPAHLVDLVGVRTRRSGGLGRPVPHLLGRRLPLTVEHRVAGSRQGTAQTHLERGLLDGLAHRRHRPGLAGVELALGPRPVVVLGPVHEGDLELASTTAPRDGSRGGDG